LLRKERSNYLLVVGYHQEGEQFVMNTLSGIRYKLKNKTMCRSHVELTVEVGLRNQEASILERLTGNVNVEKAFVLEYSGEYKN